MGGLGICALHLFLHVPDLQGENAQTVYGPCRTLGIQSSLRQHFHLAIVLTEPGVDFLHEVCTVLIALVDTALQGKGLHRIDVRIANQVLIMPLNGIDPAFQIEAVLDTVFRIWITDGCIDIIGDVIVGNHPIENLVGLFRK